MPLGKRKSYFGRPYRYKWHRRGKRARNKIISRRHSQKGWMRNVYWFKRSFTTIVAAPGQGQDRQIDANGFIAFTNKLSDLPDYSIMHNIS